MIETIAAWIGYIFMFVILVILLFILVFAIFILIVFTKKITWIINFENKYKPNYKELETAWLKHTKIEVHTTEEWEKREKQR